MAAQFGGLLATWLSNHIGPDAAKQLAKEVGYNDSPFFGAEKKKVLLVGELAMLNAALAIFSVNQVFNAEDAKSVIDPFLAKAKTSIFCFIETKDSSFHNRYQVRMTEYFQILSGENPPIGLSFAFMTNLRLDPLKNPQGQMALALKLASSVSETVKALQVMAKHAGA
ncbi:MAG: hypothetical protein H0W78_13140 [Planctomycetes bacterium]|nr:hypothetical protein [Planctomycetota bacterium]